MEVDLRGISSRFALTVSLFFEELLGVFRPISRRDIVLLNGLSESLAQSVKVKGPQLFTISAVQFCGARPHQNGWSAPRGASGFS